MSRSRGLRGLALALSCLLGPGVAGAARPLDTEDTGTNEPAQFQLELGATYTRDSGDPSWALSGVLSLGVLSGLEVRAESALLRVEPEDQDAHQGPGDSLLGIKYRLLDETESVPAVLAALAVRFPTGDAARGLGAEGEDVLLLVAASKAFGPVTLTGNVGYTFVTADRDQDAWTLAASAEYHVTKRWTLVGELVGSRGARRAADSLLVRGGLLWAVTQRIQVDAAVGVGLTRESPDVVVTLGATLGF